jgi:uncharacterized RDD family membrane protein YckC
MDEHNPYRASGALLVQPLEKPDIESAAKVRRFFNWLIDNLMTAAWAGVLGVMIAAVGGDAGAAWLGQTNKLTDWALGAVILVAYYVVMEGAFGFTIGKLITGTRVVDEYGRPPGFARALLRALCRLIPFNAFSLLISDDDVRRGWHDRLSRSYVVDRPRNGRAVSTPRVAVHDASPTA